MFGKKKDIKKKEDESNTASNSAVDRRKLFKSLSQSEKSLKRSTIGTQTLGIPTGKSFVGALDLESQRIPVKETKVPDMTTTDEAKKKPKLSLEEKRTRRKSLLAPVQNFFHLSKEKKDVKIIKQFGTDELKSVGKEDDSPKKPKKKNLKKKDFQSTIEKDANENQTRIQKERQKKLQKELDKIEKEKSKQENNLLYTSLNQILESGKVKARMPEPEVKYQLSPSIRPPVIVQR